MHNMNSKNHDSVVRLTSDDITQRVYRAREEMTEMLLRLRGLTLKKRKIRGGDNLVGTQVVLDWLLQLWDQTSESTKSAMARVFTTSVYNYPFSRAPNPGQWTERKENGTFAEKEDDA